MSLLLLVMALAQPSLTVTTLARSDLSGIDRAQQVTVQTSAEWSALWKAHAPEQPAPIVDFAGNTVLAVFLGGRPTSGYSIEIRRVTADREAVTVEYVERQPDRDAITAQILTAPCHIVSIPKQSGAVKFVRVEAAGRD